MTKKKKKMKMKRRRKRHDESGVLNGPSDASKKKMSRKFSIDAQVCKKVKRVTTRNWQGERNYKNIQSNKMLKWGR